MGGQTMRRIALVNQKGGCGKTTTAVNLASGLAVEGRRVLLIDLDPQGHSGLGLGIDTAEMSASIYEVLSEKIHWKDAVMSARKNLSIVLSDVVLSAFEQVMSGVPEREYRLARSMDDAGDHYDYLIIDSPPSVGLLTFNGLMAADEVIIPVDPSYFSLHGLQKLIETIQVIEEKTAHSLSMGILITNVDPRTNFCKRIIETLTTHFPELVFRTVIHTCTCIREAASVGKSVLEFDNRCKAFHDFQGLVQEVLDGEQELKKRSFDDAYPSQPFYLEKDAKDVIFRVDAPPDARVQIAGDFNAWQPEPLKYRDHFGKQSWQKHIALESGTYQYKYLVNGEWMVDPKNERMVADDMGNHNSLVKV